MAKVTATIEKDFTLAQVDERLFSSFIEHLGRAVYTGIYEPGHPDADEQGFRRDVIDLVKELKVPLVRYPGGNFLSGYAWRDGVGPVSERPARLDLAWHSIEPNTIGIGEFYDWSRKAGTGIMGAVNMGTGTPKEAGEFLEYCNFPGGTALSDLRKKHGHAAPFDIKTWCVGNEMDGPWQTCHLDAADYGKKARETAKIMKWIDPSVQLVVCGSATTWLPSYPEWDRVVLEHTYEQADFLSIHRYYENFGNNDDFLASFMDMNDFIKTMCATADYVKALKRSKKTLFLSFDEWNVWYQQNQKDHEWETAPRILEDRYSLLDALVVGGLGITLLNNCDRVKMACLAQLVNVIAPIFTEPGGKAFRQTIYWPYHDISVYGRGTALSPVVKGTKKETKYGDAPVVPLAAVHDEAASRLTVFALNTDTSASASLSLDLRSFGAMNNGKTRCSEWRCLDGGDLDAKNTIEKPDTVAPRAVSVSTILDTNGVFSLELPKSSWNVLRFNRVVS